MDAEVSMGSELTMNLGYALTGSAPTHDRRAPGEANLGWTHDALVCIAFRNFRGTGSVWVTLIGGGGILDSGVGPGGETGGDVGLISFRNCGDR